jgi:mannose-6-phosphate isomerase-like protein (cupin superfamily)
MKTIIHQDNVREVWRPGVETRMLVSAGNGATQLCIFEQWIAPGNGAPTHMHPVEEVLTVLEGEAEMWLDDVRVVVGARQSLIVPARLSQFRQHHASPAYVAGIGDFRSDAGGCDRARAAAGS